VPRANCRRRCRQAWERAQELGVTNVRTMLYIHNLHPCRGAEADQSRLQYERLVNEARQRGIKVQLVLTGVADGWGVPMRNGTPCARATGISPSVSEYRAFVSKWVPHFNRMGVKRFSLWVRPLVVIFCRAEFSS
jgi:hypothetical protein